MPLELGPGAAFPGLEPRATCRGLPAQAAELVDLKAAFPWVAEAPHHCLQQTLRDLDQAFRHFFAGRTAYPVFRKRFRE